MRAPLTSWENTLTFKLQNARPLIFTLNNNNSAFCLMLHSSKFRTNLYVVAMKGRGGGAEFCWRDPGALGFSLLQFKPFFRSAFVAKNISFSFFMFVAVSVIRSRFSVFSKNKSEFSDLLFDAVFCFPSFSSKNMRLNNLNHNHMLNFSEYVTVTTNHKK